MMRSLVWFTNNLRVKDNLSLFKACTHKNVVGVYFFDPRQYGFGQFGFTKTGPFRAKFLWESINELKKNLKKLNISLLVYHKKPEDFLPKLVQEYDITTIYTQLEWTRDENRVLQQVKNKVGQKVEFVESCDQFLFHPEDVPYSSFSDIPEVFTFFRKKCEQYCKVKLPLGNIPPKAEANRIPNDTQLPPLEDLGYSRINEDHRSVFPFRGGENQALERLQEYFWQNKKLSVYKKTRNGLVGKDYSSKLSAWLANGSISPRTIYWEVKKYESEIIKNQDTYWLVFELIWRDFFKYISLKHGNKIFWIGGILDKKYQWGNNEKAKQNWINGNTNEPFVNANMKELAMTGWMSNRGRQNVASYWAKELKQDWRIGASYFESMLIDYDVHSNWGNWMYNSGVGNDPRDRKFNIKRQAEMYDPKGTFQKLWLQETLF